MPQIPVRFEVEAAVFDLDGLEREMADAMEDIAEEAAEFWKSEAGRRLRSSRLRYQSGIGTYTDFADGSATVYLEGDFPNRIEQGMDAFDMKPGFLASPKMRVGPVKFPRAVAANFVKTGRPKATRWMVIPLNTNRDVYFGRPGAFRTFTDAQPGNMWNHPGMKGVNIAQTVEEEIDNVIAPKHVTVALIRAGILEEEL